MSWKVGADIIIGATLVVAQNVNLKVCGFLDSYKHMVIKCKVG